MKRVLFLAVAVVLLASAPAMACCYLNKDVHNNTGQPAWDIKMVFNGVRGVLSHYDGYPGDWRFRQFSTWVANGRTYLRWFDPVGPDGTPAPIPHCQMVHIGYRLTGPAPLIHAWWTDEAGCPLPFGHIQQPSHWVEWDPTFPGRVLLRLVNDFAGLSALPCVPPCPDPTVIGVLFYAITDQEIPLDQLNAQNPDLDTMLLPHPDGAGIFTLPAVGDEVVFEIPEPMTVGQVLVYRLEGFGGNDFMDFGQHMMEPPVPAPEWSRDRTLLNQLFQSEPNPANPSARIRYAIAEKGHVSLRIYDIEGRLVRTLVDEVLDPSTGSFEAFWDGRNDAGERVSTGTYFYQLEAPGYMEAKKMVILR